MLIQDVFSTYKDDLQQVEKCINNNVISEIKLIPEIAHHLIDSGGKRFRPLLLLTCARLCGYRGEHRFPMATVMEFIHTATLLHDDVIDQAAIRRGKDSANKIFGNYIIINAFFDLLKVVFVGGENILNKHYKFTLIVGLLKNAHLLRCAANRAAQRMSIYASRFDFCPA